MGERDGHIELDRTIESITIGRRHREELGDLDDLVESISKQGLLQPVTITPDGVLVCGRRRIEAVKRLGWRTLKVWVRAGISDQLSKLLAEQDENTLRKDLTPEEQARLFAELTALMKQDSQRRQEETQFGADRREKESGVESTPPHSPGKTRTKAAQLVTGSDSHQRLERINAIRAISVDPNQPEHVRALARTELDRINAGGSVAPAFHRLQALIDPASTEPRKRTSRAFVLTWSDLDGWTEHYDVNTLAAQLSEADCDMFERVLAESQGFAHALRSARSLAAVG